ncbi:hypothetical protein Cantr_07065 [Candida viswanathii]|uniref:Uncharacterized protein n=1 Tax=Candida viswanathii TaxID=5486 RepID=A0A367Y0L5_9ASCO|nr:hypothetical protein Cantr_07065 [Candida viswanathii]
MVDYSTNIVVFKRAGGAPLFRFFYDSEFSELYEIIDYEDVDFIKDFLSENVVETYVVQTKTNQLRLQSTEYDMDFHRLLDLDDEDEEEFALGAMLGHGAVDDTIEEHMEDEDDHSKCAIE